VARSMREHRHKRPNYDGPCNPSELSNSTKREFSVLGVLSNRTYRHLFLAQSQDPLERIFGRPEPQRNSTSDSIETMRSSRTS
jgi:hypothetical protein